MAARWRRSILVTVPPLTFAETNLDLLLAFACVVPDQAAYEDVADVHDVDVSEGLFSRRGFGLMLRGSLARLHCMALIEGEPESDEAAAALGVAQTDNCDELRVVHARLRAELERRLGPPLREDSWRSECLLHESEHAYALTAWSLGETLLALLLDEEGDAHIGELGALDLRIAPIDHARTLPDSVRGPFGWPVHES